MPAGIFHFTNKSDDERDAIEVGATLDRTFEYKDNAGAAINLTGYTARMQVRDKADATVAILDLKSTSGTIVLGGAAGTVRLLMPEAQMRAITVTEGVYDLDLVSGSTVIKFLAGDVEFTPRVTHQEDA